MVKKSNHQATARPAPKHGADDYRPPDHRERQRIVDQLDTTMLVEAAAGTGKTTSMIDRMVALLREGKCTADTLAAVTFTRKSASEMRARFQAELQRAAREQTGPHQACLAAAVTHMERCFIGTIHSFCARLLRERPIEAGVDLAFEELDPERDAQLRDRAWSDYRAELEARDDKLLTEVAELGLDAEQLRTAFASFALYPDVDEWPAPTVELGDLKPVTRRLHQYVQHMETLVPTFPDERGNDRLMGKYELLVRRARVLDLDRTADLMSLLEQFGSPRAVQKQWPAGGAQGKQEKARWEEFAERYAQPLVQRWKETRYVTVVQLLAQAQLRYDRLRAASGKLNYQDLLMQAAALLRDKPAIRSYFRRRFSHLCVDEFQDTDPIQAEVMMYLTATDPTETNWRQCRPAPGSLFVVGDPKQSIYRFRRADIVTYNRVKQIIEDSGGDVVALTANFRTLETLVQWGNKIFDEVFPAQADAYASARCPMLVGRRGGEEGDWAGLAVLTVPSDISSAGDIVEYEAERIARSIRHALDAPLTVPRSEQQLAAGRSPAASPGDFLIVTKNKWNLAAFAAQLQALGIPYQVTGSSALSQVRELALLATCLAALVEPDNPVALVAVLRGDLFGFSDEDLFAYKTAGGQFSHRAPIPENLAARVTRRFEEAFGKLNGYASWLNRLPPVAAFERIAADLGLYVRAAAAAGGDIQAGTMAKAIEVLRSVQGERHSVAALVEHLQELIDQDVEFDALPARPHDGTAVRIMNLHKVKGLEAPVVFLADATGKKTHGVRLHIDRSGDATRGYLAIYGPARGRAAAPLLARPAGWDDRAAEEGRFSTAEEERLLYVAATRAGTQLVISQRASGGPKNPWQFFAPYLKAAEELSDPGPQSPPASIPIPVCNEDIEAAQHAAAQRWQAAQRTTYATTAAKEIAVRAGGAPAAAGSGEHGTEWGTVIHLLLETAMQRPAADLAKLARMALAEQELDVGAAETAVEVVRQVTESEIWKRATASQQQLVEVPFETCLPAEQRVDGLPTIVRGVIDLVFWERDGWVITDYKTDRAALDQLSQLTEHYRPQVDTYAQIWSDITGQAVREKGLFFTAVQRYVTL